MLEADTRMRYIPLVVCGLVIIAVVVLVGLSLINSHINETLEGSDIPQPLRTLISVVPVVFAILGLSFAIQFGLAGERPVDEDEEAYYIDTADIAIEPGTLKVRDAKKILKIRYAKGDISSVEYLERMSRL
jgi:uncharacterized membrane protein